MNLTFRVAVMAAVVVSGFFSTAQAAYVASLANDFTYAVNSTSSTWSFGQEDNNTSPLTLNLYTDVRGANTMWGAMAPSVPSVWADIAGGYWGIGKNTSGVTVTGSNFSWAPDAVLFHPQLGFPVGRLDIVWTAPSAMTVDANWTFATATTEGDGVGLQLSKLSGGVMTTLIGFGAGGVTMAGGLSTPIVGSLLSYSVAAGDKLFFQMDNWPNAVGDITSAAITITQIPEPSSVLLLGLGSVALVHAARRKKGLSRNQ